MSVFNPGTNGTLKSLTIPSAFLELALILELLEKQIPEADRPNNIAITFDLESNSANITATIPIVSVTTSSGEINISAVDYLS